MISIIYLLDMIKSGPTFLFLWNKLSAVKKQIGSRLHYQDKNVGVEIPAVDQRWSTVQGDEWQLSVSFTMNSCSRT